MELDVRQPIGAMFAVVGALLAIYGAATGGDGAMYARALGVNINLWWGLVMLAFGGAFLFLGRCKRGNNELARFEHRQDRPGLMP